MVSTQHSRQVLERFDALLAVEHLDELDELCTPDMVNHALTPDDRRAYPAHVSSWRPRAVTR